MPEEKEILEIVAASKTEVSPNDNRTVSQADIAFAPMIPLKHEIVYKRPNKHQKKLGICTGADVADAVEEFARRYLIEKGIVPEDWEGSMGLLYKIGKLFIDGNLTEGSSIFTMLKAAQKFGIPSEALFPTDYNQTYAQFMSNIDITQAMLDDAAKHKIPGYASVPLDQASIVRGIYQSRAGILVRMNVGKNWYTDKNGLVTWDKKKLEPLRPLHDFQSGHAVKFTAFDQTSDIKVKARNSWGETYCNKGDIDLYLKDHTSDITEAWTITDKILFIKDLRIGDTHADVKRLQEFLNAKGFVIASSGPGSAGQETEYFGILTHKAVARYQKARGLPDTGFFGPLTRSAANKEL